MTISGLSAEDAVWHALHLKGRRYSRQELRDGCGADWSPESMRRHLRARDVRSRLASMSNGELERLDLPALAQLDDGTWLLLLHRQGDHCVVEQAGGPARVSTPDLRIRLSGLSLELGPELPRAVSLWRLLGASLARRRGPAFQVAAAGLLMQFLALVSPQFTRLALDHAFPAGAVSLLRLVALGIVLTGVFRVWLGWLRAVAILYVRTRVDAEMERDVLAHILDLPFSILQRTTVGHRLQAFFAVGQAREFLAERGLGTVLDGVMAVSYVVVMTFTMAAPTLAVVTVALLIGVFLGALAHAQAKLQGQEVDALVRERGFLVELLWGAATVKAAGAERAAWRRWMGYFRAELTISLRRQRLGVWSGVGLETVRQGLVVLLLIWGGKLAIEGRIGVGTLFAFVQMSTGLVGAAMGVAGTYAGFVMLKPQIARLEELLGAQRRPKPRPVSTKALPVDVDFDDVWFRYDPGSAWIIRGLSLKVQAGEKRCLRAPSGAGKTTILRLIAGLYPAERGRISVGGLEPSAAVSQMTYMPQHVELYEGSIAQNLRVLSAGASRDRLIEAAKASGLDAFVSSLPMGYDTRLAQRGATLSGGQRQLIALTAAMASCRNLLLLDEAFANLDRVLRTRIIESAWFADKTVIYASHEGGFKDHETHSVSLG